MLRQFGGYHYGLVSGTSPCLHGLTTVFEGSGSSGISSLRGARAHFPRPAIYGVIHSAMCLVIYRPYTLIPLNLHSHF